MFQILNPALYEHLSQKRLLWTQSKAQQKSIQKLLNEAFVMANVVDVDRYFAQLLECNGNSAELRWFYVELINHVVEDLNQLNKVAVINRQTMANTLWVKQMPETSGLCLEDMVRRRRLQQTYLVLSQYEIKKKKFEIRKQNPEDINDYLTYEFNYMLASGQYDEAMTLLHQILANITEDRAKLIRYFNLVGYYLLRFPPHQALGERILLQVIDKDPLSNLDLYERITQCTLSPQFNGRLQSHIAELTRKATKPTLETLVSIYYRLPNPKRIEHLFAHPKLIIKHEFRRLLKDPKDFNLLLDAFEALLDQKPDDGLRTRLNMIEMLTALKLTQELSPYLGMVCSPDPYKLSKQLNGYLINVHQNLAKLLLQQPYQTNHITTFMMVTVKLLHNYLILSTQDVTNSTGSAISLACSYIKHSLEVCKTTLNALRCTFGIDTSYHGLYALFVNPSEHLKLSKSKLTTLIKNLWIVQRLASMYGLTELRLVCRYSQLAVSANINEPELKKLFREYLLSKCMGSLSEQQQQHLRGKFLLDIHVPKKDQQVLRALYRHFKPSNRAFKIKNSYSASFKILKQPRPLNEQIQYWEHFIKYYAFQIFEFNSNAKSFQEYYETGQFRLLKQIISDDFPSKSFIKDVNYKMYRTLLKLLVTTIQLYYDWGFYHSIGGLNKNISVLLLRLQALEPFLAVQACDCRCDQFQLIVDEVSGVAQYLNETHSEIKIVTSENTRKSLYRRRSVHRDTIQITGANLLQCFDNTNMLRSTRLYATFREFLIRQLSLQRFGEAMLQQEIVAYNSADPVTAQDFKEITSPTLLDLIRGRPLEAPLEPQQITSRKLMRQLVPLLVLGGIVKPHANGGATMLNWIQLLEMQQCETIQDRKRQLYLGMKLVEALPLDVPYANGDRSWHFLHVAQLCGMQVDHRLLMASRPLPSVITQNFGFYKSTDFQLFVEAQPAKQQYILLSDDQVLQRCRKIAIRAGADIIAIYLLQENGERILLLSRFLYRKDQFVSYRLRADQFQDHVLEYYCAMEDCQDLFKGHEVNANENLQQPPVRTHRRRQAQDRLLLKLLDQIDHSLSYLQCLLACNPAMSLLDGIIAAGVSSLECAFYLACCMCSGAQPSSEYLEQDLFWQRLTPNARTELMDRCMELEEYQPRVQFPILLLDPKLQQVPWEHLPCVEKQQRCFTRVLSLRHLAACQRQDQTGDLYYVLNPSQDLKRTENSLSGPLQSVPNSTGLIGEAPNNIELLKHLAEPGTYFYIGHGAGQQYLSEAEIRLASTTFTLQRFVYLFGCNSACLLDLGRFRKPHKELIFAHSDLKGIVLDYVLCGTPNILGCLYLITDTDVDSCETAMLSNLERTGRTNVMDVMINAKRNCSYKAMNGCALVVYGLGEE